MKQLLGGYRVPASAQRPVTLQSVRHVANDQDIWSRFERPVVIAGNWKHSSITLSSCA